MIVMRQSDFNGNMCGRSSRQRLGGGALVFYFIGKILIGIVVC